MRFIKLAAFAIAGFFCAHTYGAYDAHKTHEALAASPSPTIYKPTPLAQSIFARILDVSGILSVDPRVHVVIAGVPGSYTDQTGTIYIAASDIKFCEHKASCIAFIMAHETGHNVLGHVRGHRYRSYTMEKDADLYAVKVLHAAGYDPCGGVWFFKKVVKADGGHDGGKDTDPQQHPDSIDRMKYLDKVCHGKIDPPDSPWISFINYFPFDPIK